MQKINQIDDQMSRATYFNKILELSSIASEDRDSNKITYEQWKELSEVINNVWVKLCDLDQLTKCFRCDEETPLKQLKIIRKKYVCKECI